MPETEVSPVPISAPGRTPRNWKKLGLAIVALVLVLGAGGIYLWLHPSHPAHSVETSGVQATLALENFIVNLSGPDERAYLRVGISLGLSHPLTARDRDDVPMALVRDTVLSVLSSAQPAQLLQAEGKRQLKAELLHALQERVPQLGVEEVYFTEFLVQM